mmetsp:Transcript_14070/g.38486  ORF Transcript_14070/g.38486 Transcript_14070/m.38486 type:complete len:316 (-) Transcript_14070:233-1180(-)
MFSTWRRLRPRGAARDLAVALPVPVDAETEEVEIAVRPGTMVLPLPMLRMPYELSPQGTTLPPEVALDADSRLFRVHLPIYFRAEVFPPSRNTECILIATHNRREWGRGGDGLTAYASVSRTDFSFRTNIFASFPAGVVQHSRKMLHQAQWNELSMAISERTATYWINGVRIATVTFGRGELPPAELYVGLLSYAERFSVRRFDVSRDPQVLQTVCDRSELRDLGLFKVRILTVNVTAMDEHTLSIACTSIAGECVASFDNILATALFKDFRRMVVDRLQWNEFMDLQLVLPSGTLLGEATDREPVGLALRLDAD